MQTFNSKLICEIVLGRGNYDAKKPTNPNKYLYLQVKEDVYKCYPYAKLGHLKTGGNFPFLSRTDEVNMHLTVSLLSSGSDLVCYTETSWAISYIMSNSSCFVVLLNFIYDFILDTFAKFRTSNLILPNLTNLTTTSLPATNQPNENQDITMDLKDYCFKDKVN